MEVVETAAPAAAPAEPPAAAPAAPPPTTVLAGGATPVAAPAAELPPAIPEKFIVKGADGNVDHQATALKLAAGYVPLEKRLGAGDAPPKEAKDYKVNLPEALAGKFKPDELSASPKFQEFLGALHGAKLTQAQVDVAVNQFLTRSLELQETLPAVKAEECTTALRSDWKTDADFDSNIQAAFKAGQHYAGKDFDGILKDYGNDPRVVRMLAAVGREMAPDGNTPHGGLVPKADVQSEVAQLAGWLNNSANHSSPEFAAKNARYTELNVRLHGNAPKAPGSVIFQ